MGSRPNKAARAPGYSIRMVAHRTGITPDTLRVWERRYGFPSPSRSDNGARGYSEEDVQRLLRISQALATGYRPGEIVPLSPEELTRVLARPGPRVPAVASTAASTALSPDDSGPATGRVSPEEILQALRSEDIERVRALLRSAAVSLGPRGFVRNLGHPLAIRVGALWESGHLEVRHEHLASALLTTELRVLLSAHAEGPRSPKVLLATLPGEPHALALDLIAVDLAANLAAPTLLGADSPPEEILLAAKALSADVVGVSVSLASDPARTVAGLRQLLPELPPPMELWVGGAGARRLGLRARSLRVIETFADLDVALASFRGRNAA